MDSPRSFRTKTGRCEIEADRIVLQRTGARGALASALIGGSVRRVLALYVLGALLLLLAAWRLGSSGQPVLAVPVALLGLLLLRGVVRSRGLSAAPVIARAAITRIEAKPPLAPVTRGHFIVHFVEAGRPVRRVVILPGVLQGGVEEFARAVALFRAAGFPLEG